MSTPTADQLRDPKFQKLILETSYDFGRPSWVRELFTRSSPRFRTPREVHAQRARKLRKRGEYAWFVRWEHGHCVYAWGGPVPQVFHYRRMPTRESEKLLTITRLTTIELRAET